MYLIDTCALQHFSGFQVLAIETSQHATGYIAAQHKIEMRLGEGAHVAPRISLINSRAARHGGKPHSHMDT
jgi:hypothetical protein